MLSSFYRFPGTQMGRIQPSGWIPPDGSYVLGLGSDESGVKVLLNGGDYIQVQQVGTALNPFTFMRLRARIRPPTVPPPGANIWVAKILLDQFAVIRIPIEGTHTRDLSDISVGLVTDPARIYGFRLELEGPDTNIEVELPAFYIDAIAFGSDTTRPVLGNRRPEPNETNVLQGTTVSVDIQDPLPGGTGIDLALTQVYLDGVLAYDGNGIGFLAGFDGPSSVADTFPDAARIAIDPTTDFTSKATVLVRVVSTTADGLASLDQSYSFTIEDKTTPKVLAAMGIATRRVRVAFDEPVLEVSADGSSDALNPANYVLVADSVPAVDVEVSSVEFFSASSVELITNIDMTPGATYVLTVSNVVDLNSNIVTDPDNVATFLAFTPPRPASRRWDLYRMLPRVNREEDQAGTKDLEKFIRCLQEVTDLMLYDIDRWTDILDPDIAPEPFIDAMLIGLGNPFPFTLSLIDKRRLIRVLVKIYKLKGTGVGIIDVVRFFLGIDVTISLYNSEDTWILGESELGETTILSPSNSYALYSFTVDSIFELTEDQRDKITQIANYMKPAHTHLIEIIEPTPPVSFDHLELGESELGVNWQLH